MTALVTLYDSFRSLRGARDELLGCYIPLALLPPSQSNLALKLHNAEGELLTDRSSSPPTGVSGTPSVPPSPVLKMLSTAVLTCLGI